MVSSIAMFIKSPFFLGFSIAIVIKSPFFLGFSIAIVIKSPFFLGFSRSNPLNPSPGHGASESRAAGAVRSRPPPPAASASSGNRRLGGAPATWG